MVYLEGRLFGFDYVDQRSLLLHIRHQTVGFWIGLLLRDARETVFGEDGKGNSTTLMKLAQGIPGTVCG